MNNTKCEWVLIIRAHQSARRWRSEFVPGGSGKASVRAAPERKPLALRAAIIHARSYRWFGGRWTKVRAGIMHRHA